MAKDYSNQKDRDVIDQFHGKNRFVKVRADAFSIGKVHFSFVETDDNNVSKASEDFYMDMGKALLIAKGISYGTLQKRAEAAISSGNIYTPLFQVQGGMSEERAAKAKKRTDGKALAKVFSICPSKSRGCPVCFRLESGAGHSDDMGLIVPEWWSGKKDAKEHDFIIPVNNEGLKGYLHDGALDAFGEKLKMAITAYYVKGFTDGTVLTPSYTPNERSVESSRQERGDTSRENGKPVQTRPSGAVSETASRPAGKKDKQFPKPVFPQGAKTMKITFDSQLTMIDEERELYFAVVRVESNKDKTLNLWFEKKKLELRKEEIEYAMSNNIALTIAYRVEPDADGSSYVWFVA